MSLKKLVFMTQMGRFAVSCIFMPRVIWCKSSEDCSVVPWCIVSRRKAEPFMSHIRAAEMYSVSKEKCNRDNIDKRQVLEVTATKIRCMIRVEQHCAGHCYIGHRSCHRWRCCGEGAIARIGHGSLEDEKVLAPDTRG